MNRLALRWIDTALALEEENRELRAIATSLLFWIIENQELLAIASEQIEARQGLTDRGPSRIDRRVA